jgi:hypothetical protein
MAHFARTSGVTFTANATPQNFNGKAPDFFAVVIRNVSATAAAITGEDRAEELVDIVTQVITSGDALGNYGANILFLQTDTTGQISFCLEGSDGGWTAALLQAAIRARGTMNGIDVSGTTVTDLGFKLALT